MAEKPVVIMTQDEGRFGCVNEIRRCWAPMGIRPCIPKHHVREYVYAYSAVAPALGKMTSLILPYSDSDMMNIFLEHVSKEFSDYFIIMQLDQAPWHMSDKIKKPYNIEFLPQPPYSPELNPTEHIWEDIREKDLPNTGFKLIKKLKDALSDGLNRLANDVEYLRSMTFFPHLDINL